MRTRYDDVNNRLGGAILKTIVLSAALGAAGGCDIAGAIQLVDEDAATFKVHSSYLTAPVPSKIYTIEVFKFPDGIWEPTGEMVWSLRNVEGRGKRNLYFTYGEIPPGFEQLVPPDNRPPQPLEKGSVYIIRARCQYPSADRYESAFVLDEELRPLPRPWEARP